MRILIVLTYFQPYKSGLTVYAVRQARALVELGHEVTVLTSQYDPDLPRITMDQGVQIIRLPVAFRISKGVIMPRMPFAAWRLVKEADIVNLHVPQVDAAFVSLMAKLHRKPVVLTYHCDLKMPSGLIHKLAGWGARLANRISANLADAIVHNTRDFAEHSSFLKQYLDKLTVIQPPIVVMPVSKSDIELFRKKYNIQPEQRVVGMVARLASEKGVEYLVHAMPQITKAVPGARAVFVGEYQNVFGERAYKEKLLPMIDDLGPRWTFLGLLSELEKAVFFHICDVLVLPSINSTESFGMVQIEAMTCGTPVVSTDLPGVRQPVKSTGLGKIVPAKAPQALGDAIIDILETNRPTDPTAVTVLMEHYAPITVAESYEALYKKLRTENEQHNT